MKSRKDGPTWETPDGIPGPYLWPGPTSAFTANWGVNLWMEDLSHSVTLVFKYISKYLNKKNVMVFGAIILSFRTTDFVVNNSTKN